MAPWGMKLVSMMPNFFHSLLPAPRTNFGIQYEANYFEEAILGRVAQIFGSQKVAFEGRKSELFEIGPFVWQLFFAFWRLGFDSREVFR